VRVAVVQPAFASVRPARGAPACASLRGTACIAWHSVTGAHNAGVVTFHRLADAKTRIMLKLEYEPEGVMENAGDWLGVIRMRTAGDLDRFKDFIEGRGAETGAWRGEIPPPDEGGRY